MKRIAVLPMAVALILSGCGNSDIAAVEKATLSNDQSFTIGQAFNNRKVCASVTWDEIKDDRDRKIVEYRCAFNGVEDYVDADVNQQKKRLEENNKTQKDEYDHDIKNEKNDQARFQQELTRYQSLPNTQVLVVATEQNIKQSQGDIDQKVAGRDAYFATLDKKLADDTEASKPKNPLVEVDEVFQWTVSEDGAPAMAYAGAELKYKDATTKDQNYRDSSAQAAIQLVVKNDATNYAQYRQELGAF